MAAPSSKIEWTDATWNPVRGCSRISEGCRLCYAERVAARFNGPGQPYEGLAHRVGGEARWTGKLELVVDNLDEPLYWRRPRRIFVNSMSDLFHEKVPDAWIDRIFATMAFAPRHTFQILTKRAARMREYCASRAGEDFVRFVAALNTVTDLRADKSRAIVWPLPNVWLGVSVEDQAAADERIPHLLATPTAVRFLSCEPLLGTVSLARVNVPGGWQDVLKGWRHCPEYGGRENTIDWVICGGESGPGARPMHPDWARSLRDQCAAAGVPFFFKQWGEWLPGDQAVEGDHFVARAVKHQAITGQRPLSYGRVGKKAAGRELDGRAWDQFPELTA